MAQILASVTVRPLEPLPKNFVLIRPPNISDMNGQRSSFVVDPKEIGAALSYWSPWAMALTWAYVRVCDLVTASRMGLSA